MTCDGNLGSKGLFPLVLSIVDSLHDGAVNRSLKKYMSHCQKAMNCPTIWFPLNLGMEKPVTLLTTAFSSSM